MKVLLTSIPGRYAKALFSYASQHYILKEMNQDLKKLDSFWHNDKHLWKDLSNAALSSQQADFLWNEVGKKLHLGHLIIHFMSLLGRLKRLSLWPSILNIYNLLVSASLCERQVTIETAAPLTCLNQEKLTQVLQNLWTDKLILNFILNPSLKTGIVIQSYNLRLDMSLKSILPALSDYLKENKEK